ncbi:MAG: hypothetical protein FJX67_17325 [Alphaproteobacteria bacterium]|nr:hypothetical protein [Alphaproteobacteria bacterium]
MLTPETERSSFYFWTHVRNFKLGDLAVSELVRENFLTALREDVTVIEGVQAGLDRFPDKAFVNIAVDAGPIRARRVLDALIEKERAGRPFLEVLRMAAE